MNCPSCRNAETSVKKTTDVGSYIVRRRACGCGATWITEETVVRSTIKTIAAEKASAGYGKATNAPPIAITNPPVSTNGAGGVGGALSSIRIRDPEIDPDPRSRSVQALIPSLARPAARVAEVGTITLPFLDVFRRYPRQHRKVPASQVWHEAARKHPGGEVALARDVGAAFDAGLLRRPAYTNPDIMKVLTFENFIAQRCWEDDEDRPGEQKEAGDPYAGVKRTNGRGGV